MHRNISLRYVIIKAELSLAAPHGENNFKESICHTLLPELHLYRITVQETSLRLTLNWPRNNMENLSVANAIQDPSFYGFLNTVYNIWQGTCMGDRPFERPLIYIRQHRHTLRCRAVFEPTNTTLERLKTENASGRPAKECPPLLDASLYTITTETYACVGDEASKVRTGAKRKWFFNNKTQWLIKLFKLLLSKSSEWTKESDWSTTDWIVFGINCKIQLRKKRA